MKDCLFCKIIKKEIPADIVFEDDKIVAFRDIKPQAPTHILIIPKKHIPTMMDLKDDNKDIIGYVYMIAKKLAKSEGIAESGFRVVVNCKADAGQEVFHIHFRFLLHQ